VERRIRQVTIHATLTSFTRASTLALRRKRFAFSCFREESLDDRLEGVLKNRGMRRRMLPAQHAARFGARQFTPKAY
jgi:hypothetical protein